MDLNTSSTTACTTTQETCFFLISSHGSTISAAQLFICQFDIPVESQIKTKIKKMLQTSTKPAELQRSEITQKPEWSPFPLKDEKNTIWQTIRRVAGRVFPSLLLFVCVHLKPMRPVMISFSLKSSLKLPVGFRANKISPLSHHRAGSAITHLI